MAKLNYLEINTWGYVIHQANIIYFNFNNDEENDKVLRSSLQKIEEALIRILDDNNTTGNDLEPPAQDLSTEYDLSDDSTENVESNANIDKENLVAAHANSNVDLNLNIDSIIDLNLNIESKID